MGGSNVPDVSTIWSNFQTDFSQLWNGTPKTVNGIEKWFFNADTLSSAFLICMGWMALNWVTSEITRNHSQVDKLWSIIPQTWVWYFALAPYFFKKSWAIWPFGGPLEGAGTRLVIMGILIGIWGARLTYNFARKGGYTWNGEDYRWEILRKRYGFWKFELFNICFISTLQHVLLLGLCVPAYVASHSAEPLNTIDYVAAAGVLLGILGETVADQQQWNFHQEKEKYKKGGKAKVNPKALPDVEAGFLRRGLFRFSRHPNFFSEMSIWWFFALFSVAAAPGKPLVWLFAAGGIISLTALFQGSTNLTEEITSSKYKEYKQYQKTTSRLIPCWPCGSSKNEKRN